MTTATYVSDSRIDVGWTPPAGVWAVNFVRENAAGQTVILNGTIHGDEDWPLTRVDGTAQANQRYRYRVVWAEPALPGYEHGQTPGTVVDDWSGYVYTTPAAPSAVTAVRLGGGNVVVSWRDNSAAETHFEVQDGTTTLGTKTESPYTVTVPDVNVQHTYRVRAATTGPRYSPWSAYSAPVAAYIAPAAPSNLTPNGSSVDVGATLTLAWTHNPLDTTPQTAYELRHRTVGAPSWTTLTGTTASSRTVTTYSTAQSVEWQVRTKGSHADYSPWSALATFALVAAPTANITAPALGATITTSTVTVAWTYFHAGGGAQTGWQVEILDGSTVVASGGGSDATASWTSGTLPNGSSLTARVRVREPSGLWSAWATRAFSVSYAPPNPSTGTAAWQDGFGHVVIAATAVSGGGKPATVSHDFARSTDGGNTWVTFATGMPLDTTVLDWEAPASGTYHYRVTAVSALPSAAHSAAVEVTVPAVAANCVIWLGGGPGFAQVVKLAANPVISYDGGRERALHAFAGRSVPVEFSSMRASKTVSVSATLMGDADPDSSTRADLEDLFDLPGPHCYRDPFGRVLYGTLSGLSWSREPGVGVGGVSFSITRSAPPDAAQAAALAGFYAPRIAEVAPGVYRFINADADEASPGVYVEVE